MPTDLDVVLKRRQTEAAQVKRETVMFCLLFLVLTLASVVAAFVDPTIAGAMELIGCY